MRVLLQWRPLGWMLAIGPVLVLAAVHVPMPFSGDSAMFVWGARELSHGARLYIDFWDMKQPGVFWFSQLAGSLFGFNEVGIHFGELLWMMALAVVLVLLAGRHLQNRWLAFLAPLFCLGPYYAVVNYQYLTMVEGLVHLPIAVFLLLVADLPPSGRSRNLRHFSAGIMMAVVAVFKLILVIVPAAILAALIAADLLAGRITVRVVAVERIVPVIGGFAIGCGCAVVWLALQGSLDPALWTSLIYPPLAISEFPHKTPEQLMKAFGWLWARVWLFALLLPAVFLLPGRARRTSLFIAVTTWIAAGTVAISIQVLSWWIYHMILLLVPFGLLGLLGVDGLISALKHRLPSPASMGACLLVLAVPLYLSVAKPLAYGVGYPLWKNESWKAKSLLEYQSSLDPRIIQLHRSTRFLLAPDALPGPIGLLGDPRVIFLSDRRPLVGVNGWTYYLQSQLDEVAATLRRDRPAYIYVSWYVAHIWRNRNDAVYNVLQSDYERLADDGADGTWFRLR